MSGELAQRLHDEMNESLRLFQEVAFRINYTVDGEERRLMIREATDHLFRIRMNSKVLNLV